MLKVIKNDHEYEEVMAELNSLIDIDPTPGTEEGDKLELLSLIVGTYEKEHFPMEDPDPIEAIKFRMDQMELTRKDLVPYIGSKSKVSEVLNHKRPLTLSMIRALNRGLGIPAKSLIKEPAKVEPQKFDVRNFPVAEPFKRGWFSVLTPNPVSLEMDSEVFLNELFSQSNLQPMMCRQKIRSKSTMDGNALLTWAAMVSVLAKQRPLPVKYDEGSIFIKDFRYGLARLSAFEEGPKLAKEYLNKRGIHLIVLKHLKKTYLDGAAMRLRDGTPVIALTLRYDRIDNFWFTLFHELAHLDLHLRKGDTECFFDDLDVDGDEAEKQADKYARDSLIPAEYIPKMLSIETLSDVVAVAHSLDINPAIVAGRLHWERKNYKQFAKLVGNHEVRKQFSEYLNM